MITNRCHQPIEVIVSWLPLISFSSGGIVIQTAPATLRPLEKVPLSEFWTKIFRPVCGLNNKQNLKKNSLEDILTLRTRPRFNYCGFASRIFNNIHLSYGRKFVKYNCSGDYQGLNVDFILFLHLQFVTH